MTTEGGAFRSLSVNCEVFWGFFNARAFWIPCGEENGFRQNTFWFPADGMSEAVHHLSFLHCRGAACAATKAKQKPNFPPVKYASVDVNPQRILKYL